MLERPACLGEIDRSARVLVPWRDIDLAMACRGFMPEPIWIVVGLGLQAVDIGRRKDGVAGSCPQGRARGGITGIGAQNIALEQRGC